MPKIGHEATNHLLSLVIRIGRGTCVLIGFRRVVFSVFSGLCFFKFWKSLCVEKREERAESLYKNIYSLIYS